LIKLSHVGALDLTDYYFEHKRQQVEALKSSMSIIEKIGKEFGALTGRTYGFFEKYKTMMPNA